MTKKKPSRTPVAKTAETTSDKAHPITSYLQQLIRDLGIKHADLVDPERLEKLGVDGRYALPIDQSYVSRLIDLAENDRPAIGSLSRLLRLLSEIAAARAQSLHEPPGNQAITDVVESWQSFLANRGDTIFYELARRLGDYTERVNPGYWLLTKEDEIAWQRSHVPGERWVVTNVIAENVYDDFAAATYALLQQARLHRLSFFLTHTSKEEAERQLSEFMQHARHSGVPKDVLTEKLRCIWLQDAMVLARIRLDDPMISQSPRTSGVISIGAETNPLLIVLPGEAIADVTRRLQPIVRAVEQGQTQSSDLGVRYHALPVSTPS